MPISGLRADLPAADAPIQDEDAQSVLAPFEYFTPYNLHHKFKFKIRDPIVGGAVIAEQEWAIPLSNVEVILFVWDGKRHSRAFFIFGLL